MLANVGEGDAVWVGVCFGIGLKVGPMAELETEDWRQEVGLDLLGEGTGVTGMGKGEGVWVRIWVGVTGARVCVGVRVRVV